MPLKCRAIGSVSKIAFKIMFCIQESDMSHSEPYTISDKDPLSVTTKSESSDDEPNVKKFKSSYTSPSLNLTVYQIPAYNTPTNSLSIYPATSTTSLPKFVNNPLNLANPLKLNNSLTYNGSNMVRSLQSRFSLPAKLTITPVQSPKPICESVSLVRYKKNGEIAKKRGPPKGYKRKPKVDLSQSFSNGALLQAQNAILTSLLAENNTSMIPQRNTFQFTHQIASEIVQEMKLPEGTELVELLLDPEDWFPSEPYKMIFSRKKNPKWKNFPYRCEHCFKGYRVASTLLTHAAERHGSVPKDLAIPCPCCPHVSTRRKHHKKHLETHESKRHRIFCLYCVPLPDPTETFVKESIKYPFDTYPQYWYASEESLRLHKKRKHPYSDSITTSQ